MVVDKETEEVESYEEEALRLEEEIRTGLQAGAALAESSKGGIGGGSGW